MIILGLLLVALICLVLGLVLPSTAWLIASLIASVGAGYVLFRARTLIAGAHAVDGGAAKTAVLDREPVTESQPPRRTRAEARAQARAAKAAEDQAALQDAHQPAAAEHDTEPAFESAAEFAHPPIDEDVAAPGADTSDPADSAVSDATDVADVSATELLGDSTADNSADDSADNSADDSAGNSAGNSADNSADDQHALVDQHVDAGDTAAAEPAAPVELAAPVADEGDVWVIDGRPRYHLATCAIIQGQDAEPIPFEQATEDGFMPCSLCEPNVVRTA